MDGAHGYLAMDHRSIQIIEENLNLLKASHKMHLATFESMYEEILASHQRVFEKDVEKVAVTERNRLLSRQVKDLKEVINSLHIQLQEAKDELHNKSISPTLCARCLQSQPLLTAAAPVALTTQNLPTQNTTIQVFAGADVPTFPSQSVMGFNVPPGLLSSPLATKEPGFRSSIPSHFMSIVHVGEYGVHWNFFFTLAAVSLLTNIINIPVHQSGVFGVSILLVYQLCLLSGLNNYLNSTQRGIDCISQNKEGIFSLVGYWGLYLLGVQLGYFFELRKSKSGFLSPAGAASIWVLTFLFWSLTAFCDRFLERVSRRSCNMGYAFFILAVNLEVAIRA
ncbi:hypothetical protein L7F22_025869 [Adiantum nelumboides]|nr:hypothetical protein [Adiantum nelumboides]